MIYQLKIIEFIEFIEFTALNSGSERIRTLRLHFTKNIEVHHATLPLA